MKHLIKIFLFLGIVTAQAQSKNQLQLTLQGFLPIEINAPNLPLDQLMELSKSWAPYFNKNGYDVSEVTTNSMVIDAKYENAYYYYNVGVKYNCDIRYSLKIVFTEDRKCQMKLTVKEIYAGNVLTKTTIADFFTSDGNVKDDFSDAKPSLENSVNRIFKSYANFISR
ncbi:MAG: hypothetical protein QM710_12855 [Flavobacterium sp.]